MEIDTPSFFFLVFNFSGKGLFRLETFSWWMKLLCNFFLGEKDFSLVACVKK